MFPTRTKVPMLIYIETISKEDCEKSIPEWEKDLLYQQIFHKISLHDEFQVEKVNQYKYNKMNNKNNLTESK